MKKIKNIKKEYIIYGIICLCFVVLSIIIAKAHEPWADEAHAWLMARDTTLKDLFTFILHVDGHPALWHIILKIFQLFGLPYTKMFIIPIIFSTLGVIVFEYKSKFPLVVKILLPFTYFIFYQYNIIARGYCLLFPLLCLIACVWEKKFDKPYLFTLLLVLLISTEAYTYIFSGMLFILYMYEMIKNKYKIKKYLPSIIIIIISFILTLLYVYPLKTNTFHPNAPTYFISDSFITSFIANNYIKASITIFILLYASFAYFKMNKLKDLVMLAFLLMPVICFYLFFYYNLWHFGIIFLLFLFITWIQDNAKEKFITGFLIITCLIQCFFSYKTVTYDYHNNYTGSKEAAEFLSNYNYNNLKIYAVGFNSSSINAYFDKNIYDNWNKEYGFFLWNTKSEYYKKSIKPENLIDSDVDIIVVSDFENYCDYPMYDYTKLESKYDSYHFDGNLYFENFLYYLNSFTIYVSKDILIEEK